MRELLLLYTFSSQTGTKHKLIFNSLTIQYVLNLIIRVSFDQYKIILGIYNKKVMIPSMK